MLLERQHACQRAVLSLQRMSMLPKLWIAEMFLTITFARAMRTTPRERVTVVEVTSR